MVDVRMMRVVVGVVFFVNPPRCIPFIMYPSMGCVSCFRLSGVPYRVV